METIVVGIDGSEAARHALARAADEAALRGARLTIICAWQIPPTVFDPGFAPVLDQATLDAFRKNAEKLVNEAVAEVERAQPSVPCDGEVLEGQPAEVLLERANDASLIVVGNRGRGGFASLLLGSVSQQVVQHAPCPVLVIRAAAAST
jgi:nucleotide-binding universal stress UspA family protein